MKIVEALRGALTGARDDLAKIDRRIAELEAEREGIERRPPHVDDVTAWLDRSLAAYEDLFRLRAGWFLNDPNLAAFAGSTVPQAKPFTIANLPTTRPSYKTIGPVLGFGSDSHEIGPADASFTVWAVAGLVRPRLRELAEELCPGCRKGMRWAERGPKLGAIDRELAELREQRAGILDELEQARAVAGIGPAATVARADGAE